MADNTEEFTVKFKSEGGDEVEQAFQKVGHSGEQAGTAYKRAGDSLDGLRLKSESRVAHNIGEIARAMSSGASAGDVLSQSITSLSESFKGSLLFAGAATVGFALYEGLTKAGDEAIKFRAHLDEVNRPIGNAAFSSIDALSAKVKDAGDQLAQLHERDLREGSGAAGSLIHLGRNLEGTALGYGGAFEQDAQDAKDKADTRYTLAKATKDLASKTYELAAAERIRNQFGEQYGALAAEELRHREALGKAAATSSLDQAQGNDLLKAENAIHHQNVEAINLRVHAQDRLLEHSEELSKISGKNIDDFTKQRALLAENVKFSDSQRGQARGPQEEKAAYAEQLSTRAALANFDRQQTFARKLELDLAKATTKELQEQAGGYERVSRLVGVEAQFHDRISKARFEGKNALANQLEQQRDLSIQNENFKTFQEQRADPAGFLLRQQKERRDRDLFKASQTPSNPNAYFRNPNAYHEVSSIYGEESPYIGAKPPDPNKDNGDDSDSGVPGDVEAILKILQTNLAVA